MATNYANAKDVLPKELLEEVQAHHVGHLWIPGLYGIDIDARDAMIQDLRRQRVPVVEIARTYRLTERRVWQILKKLGEGELNTAS